MLVKVEGEGRLNQTNTVTKLGPESLICVVHSIPHNDMYQLVGNGGFLQSPRARETLEAVPQFGGGWQTIEDHIGGDGLKEQWERCKTHQVGDKGFKTVAPGTMVRNRAQGAQALGDELHKKSTCERFNKCWQEQKQQLAIPNTTGRAKRKATYTIEFPKCHGLLSKDDYTLHVNVVKAYADFKATTDRDAYQHKKREAIEECFGVEKVEKKHHRRFNKITKEYAMQVGVDDEDVKLMRLVCVDGVDKHVEVVHEENLANVLWDLHTTAAVDIKSCHSPSIMHNAAQVRYDGINQEFCRAFKKCCTMCGIDVYKKAKKVQPGHTHPSSRSIQASGFRLTSSS